MKKVSIITLGCKVNQYESDAIKFALSSAGFEVVNKLQPADYYIINSCAVTNEAEHKSREQISKIIKLNPDAKIYVCGCSGEVHPDSFLEKQNVEFVSGTENKLQVVDAIINGENGKSNIRPSSTYFDGYSSLPSKTRGHIKIQDGCNNFCSYCIIPFTRGRERSRSLQSIKKEATRLAKLTREIVLVGINIASYGRDLKPKRTLLDVVKLFESFPDVRLRFSSFEMGTLTTELLDKLASLPSFCPFFHISLQSASNNVLKKMNRHHTFEDYLALVTEIRKRFPDAGISTDIIAGFPTESEADFEEGLENIKKIKFSNLHVFPYSKREGTVASKLPQINGTIIKERAKKVAEIGAKDKADFIHSSINKVHEVLVEELKKGFFSGYTKNYIKTYLPPNDKIEINKVYKVKLIAPYLDGAMGEIVEV